MWHKSQHRLFDRHIGRVMTRGGGAPISSIPVNKIPPWEKKIPRTRGLPSEPTRATSPTSPPSAQIPSITNPTSQQSYTGNKLKKNGITIDVNGGKTVSIIACHKTSQDLLNI